jgi:hypothetical protein
MGLGVSQRDARAIAALDPEIRVTAEALGAGLAPRLIELAPGMTRDGAGDDAELTALALDREEEPDPLSLVACLGAHRAYVGHRGQPDGLSLGALALARLLVWATRAAMIGPAPEMVWLGPASRAPEPAAGQHVISARCRARLADGAREARAKALVRAPLVDQSK